MMQLYLIRHTRPDVPEGLCYGRHDVALHEDDFAARLPLIAAHLPAGLALHCSPASRCTRLAQALVSRGGGSLAQPDARLHEMHFGDWEARLWRDLPREETLRWTGDIVGETPPGGENFMEMWARVAAFREEVIRPATQKMEALGIVGHAGSLKVLIMQALKLPPLQYGAFDLAQGHVSRIDVRVDAAGALAEKLVFLNR
ncbi:MAG TPA: histidine phosphatase family protein [Burkholderiales bacterium]